MAPHQPSTPVPSAAAGCAPAAAGLYDPRHEHDACGVGFVVNIKGHRSHAVIEKGLSVDRKSVV